MGSEAIRRIATAAICLSALAAAPVRALDLVNIWRPQGSDTASRVVKEQVPGVDGFYHGTYESQPYLAISHGADRELRLFSDGLLRARLVPVAGGDVDFEVLDLASGRLLATLRGKDPRCIGRPSCIAFDGVAADAGLSIDTDAIYVPMVMKRGPAEEANSRRQVYGDMFAPLAHDWAMVLNCYNIADLDIWKPNDTGGCTQAVFAEPGEDSLDYAKVTPIEGGSIAMPYGWTYEVVSETRQSEQSRLIESADELAQTEQTVLGFKAGVNLFVVDTSVNYRKTDRTHSEQLMQQKVRFAQSDYLRADWAVVLDKSNVQKSSNFASEVEVLRQSRDFDYFVREFGTHYPYATTFGGRGQRQASISETQLMKLAESGVDVAMGTSVGLSIPTEAGNVGGSGAVDGGNASDSRNKLSSLLGAENIRSECIPGSGCVDGRPGSGAIPVQWDLRPLSDLLAPPFYTDEETVVTLRDGVIDAIRKRLAVVTTRTGLQGARYAQVTGVPPTALPMAQCGAAGNIDPTVRNNCCGLVNVVISDARLKGAVGDITPGAGAAGAADWFPRPGGVVRSVANAAGLFESVTVRYVEDRAGSDFSSAPPPPPRTLRAAPNQPLLDPATRQPIVAFTSQATAAALPMAWDDAVCSGVGFDVLLTVRGLSARELLHYSERQLSRTGP
jgi:hypothetical protein